MCGNASLCCSFVLSTFKLNLSLIFPNRDRCHYFLESVVITPLYPNDLIFLPNDFIFKFSVNARCHYLLEPIVKIPLYPNDLIFLPNDFIFKFSVNTRCDYLLKPVVIIPLYPKNMLPFHSSDCEEKCFNTQENCAKTAEQAAGGKKPNYRKCFHAFDMCAEECPKETKQYVHILHLFELIFLIRAL